MQRTDKKRVNENSEMVGLRDGQEAQSQSVSRQQLFMQQNMVDQMALAQI